MAWFINFLDKLFPTKLTTGADTSTIVIDIPAELYYKELAVYTATSLISGAISRSEIKVMENGKVVKNADYYLLNVSPNKNETASIFRTKLINKVIRDGQALVVSVGGCLYVADSFAVDNERPILGDVYSNVTLGSLTLNTVFTYKNSYLFKMNNVNVSNLISGMYDDFGKILSSAAKAFRNSNGQKYKLHIEGVKAGDDDFNEEFNNFISNQLKAYMQGENAVYPEFDGYQLTHDDSVGNKESADFIALKQDMFRTVAHAFHIPDSLLTGNITNMEDIMAAFLSFGVDPYAQMMEETLNKVSGVDNYLKGNFYRVNTGRVKHRDIFDVAVGVSNLISSCVMCVDEVREELDYAPLDTEWSKKHFITKNFEGIEEYLANPEGGERDE